MSDPEGPSPGVRLGYWLSSEEHDPRELVRNAVTAEHVGVTTAMVSDHLQPWVPAQGNAPHVWTVLGGIASVTERLEIGTGVTALVDRRGPIEVAHAAATAAVMFEGRFFLGVGTGERLNEQPLGARWPRAGERRDRLRDGVELMRRLWAGETVDERGRAWVVERLELMTRPAVPPPVFVAGSGKRSARLAGEVGDGLVGVAPDASLVATFRGSGGTGKRCLGQVKVSVAPTLDEARDLAWRWWPNSVVPADLATELATPSEFAAVAAAIGPGSIDTAVVCATDATPIVGAIDRFVGAGFDTVYLHQVGPDQVRLFDLLTTELLPHYAF